MINIAYYSVILSTFIFQIKPKNINESPDFPLNYYLLFVVTALIVIIIVKKKNQGRG